MRTALISNAIRMFEAEYASLWLAESVTRIAKEEEEYYIKDNLKSTMVRMRIGRNNSRFSSSCGQVRHLP